METIETTELLHSAAAGNPASFIDHTLLKASATADEIGQLCAEALRYGFAAVCVNPVFVKTARRFLSGSSVKTAAVTGFPLGASTTETKVFETGKAVADGADEIDTVISLAMAKEHLYNEIRTEIAAIRKAAPSPVVLKVILEMCELSDEEKPAVCRAALEGGADCIKTSTGFGKGGATVEDVRLMRQLADEFTAVTGKAVFVKAAGGIRDYKTAQQMIKAGASRLGTSSGTAIYHQWEEYQCKN